jgi:hypothetical protein
MIISEEIQKHRTKKNIEITTSFLELMKGKTHSEIKSLTRLIVIISAENSKLECT